MFLNGWFFKPKCPLMGRYKLAKIIIPDGENIRVPPRGASQMFQVSYVDENQNLALINSSQPLRQSKIRVAICSKFASLFAENVALTSFTTCTTFHGKFASPFARCLHLRRLKIRVTVCSQFVSRFEENSHHRSRKNASKSAQKSRHSPRKTCGIWCKDSAYYASFCLRHFFNFSHCNLLKNPDFFRNRGQSLPPPAWGDHKEPN